MIERDHPFFFLEPLFSRKGSLFHFSRYVYTPDSLLDEREFLAVRGEDLDAGWVEEAMRHLASDQELAFHSNVTIDGRTWHIPMMDFCIPQLGARDIDRVRAFLPRQVFNMSAYYLSGTSFHAYSTRLLQPKDWLNFMGRMLLINRPGSSEIIDTRWVGHRLIAGYGSLRFSNNSGRYLGMPREISIGSFTRYDAAHVAEPRGEFVG